MNSSLLTVIRSLNLQEDRRAELRRIQPGEWPALLQAADRLRISLPLGIRCRDYLIEPVRGRLDENLANNILRQNRLFDEYNLLAGVLRKRRIEFVVLKGLSHIAPYYVEEQSHRPQYDIDLFIPSSCLDDARDALIGSGLSPIRRRRSQTDHLAPMMRNTNWKWRGDYYDPDLPLTIELHYRFWDPGTERLIVPCVDNFWERRTSVIIRGVEVPILDMADGVSYAALHLVRHLLRGDLRIYHVYELAYFLDHTADADGLWFDWQTGRAGNGSTLEAVAFRLAMQWFGCKVHPIVDQAVKALPAKVGQWFEVFGDSPLAIEKPNKDELFLHLSLLENTGDRVAVLARRLFPFRAPKLVEPVASGTQRRLKGSGGKVMRQTTFVLRRFVHHLSTAVQLMRSLFRWKAASRKYAVS